jgi:hypothetical protein
MHIVHRDHLACASSGRRGNFAAVFGLIGILIGGAIVSSASSQASARPSSQQAENAPVRIGTYDSRAVAIAYAYSDGLQEYVSKAKKALDHCVETGDTRRVRELTDLRELLQIRLNLQSISTAPISDILDTVREKLPQVAQQHDVVLIARAADYQDDDAVELVDVTDTLVALFEPDDAALHRIAELCKNDPVPIEVIARKPMGD